MSKDDEIYREEKEVLARMPPSVRREHVFSPCFWPDGTEYHLVVLEARIGMLRHSPLRVHATASSVDLARSKAMEVLARASTSLRLNPPSSAR